MPLQPHRPPLRVEEFEDAIVVTVAAEDLGEANAEPVVGELSAVADRLARRSLQVDLGGVRYLTSTALGKLVALHKRVRAGGGRLALVNVAPLVFEVFEVTNLHRVLDVRRGPGRPASPLAS